MAEQKEWREELIGISRVTKVVAGGKRMNFRAVVVIGDERGRVGLGLGKALEVADAVKKATQDARKNLIRLPLVESTIPHEIVGRQGASRVMLRPAAPGTGVVAGGAARIVLSVAGVRDVLAKSLGSSNAMNLAKATYNGLRDLRDPRLVAQIRGVPLKNVWTHPRLPSFPLEEKPS